ncbi:hypothetical protein SAMN06297358_1273 [Pedobacter xixiisoli]|uniref:DUF6850 domain-containing protein n=1 Tax=Pedobacter xixiisoli TaxID=1476464 RepID=A0A285ZW19_9SPHI|nr:hypothetical protein SAMN06297358_1273 [Pedobacter xixiisoli]
MVSLKLTPVFSVCLILLGLVIFDSQRIAAQETAPINSYTEKHLKADSLVEWKHRPSVFPWLLTGELGPLDGKQGGNYGSVGLGYENISGDFKRPQEARRIQQYGLRAQGYRSLRKWRFYGEFAYQKLKRDSINFSNVARPYEGSPFITADSIGGNWKADQLKGMLQVAYPAVGRWSFATSLDYLTEQGSRGNDPRPIYRYLDMEISQSLSYQLGKQSRLTLRGGYRRLTETIETGQVSRNNSKLYSLRGYGTYDFVPVVSASRYNHGSAMKGGLLFMQQNEIDVWLLGGDVSFLAQDAEEGISEDPVTKVLSPLLVGGYDEMQFHAYGGYQRSKPSGGWSFNFDATLKDGKAFDPRFNGVNAERFLWNIVTQAAYWKPRANGGQWRLAYHTHTGYLNHYEFMTGTDWDALNFEQLLELDWRFGLRKSASVSVVPSMGYSFPLKDALSIARPTVISNLLEVPDHAIMSSSYLLAGMGTSVTFPVNKQWYRLTASYELRSTKNALQRNHAKISLNMVF